MVLNDIPKSEKLNNVSISVDGYEDGKDGDSFIYPLKVSREVNDRHVNLLLTANDSTNHYCYIKDFGKLVGSQYSKSNDKKYFCRFCLHGFSSHSVPREGKKYRRSDEQMKTILSKHETCFVHRGQRVEYPVEGSVVEFENVQKQLQAPSTVDDFDSILEQLSSRAHCLFVFLPHR